MALGDPVYRKKNCSPYDIGLVLGEIRNYSPHDKLNVWRNQRYTVDATMGITVDQAFEEIGSMGRYQIRLVLIFLYFAFFVVGFQSMLMSFIAAEPGWQCVSNSTACNVTGVHRPGSPNYEYRCSVPRSEWEFTDEFTSTVTQWDLVCKDSILQSFSSSAIFAGWLVGDIILAWLSDKTGRRKVMYFAAITVTLAAVGSALAPPFWMFALFRGLVGFNIGGANIAQFVLMTEFVGVRHRNVAGTIVWYGYTLAHMTTPLVAYYVRSWRMLTIAVTVAGVPFALFWWFIPESIRWLLVKGRLDEANTGLQKVAKYNRISMPTEPLNKPETESKNLASFRDLFRTRQMAHRTLLMWFTWLVISMVYYGVSISSPSLGGNRYLNFFLTSIVEVPGNLIAIICMKRFGRKMSVVVGMICGALAAMGAVLLTIQDSNSDHIGYLAGRIIMAMLAKFFVLIAFDAVYVYTAELFPTVIRNIGMGTSSAAARIGSYSSSYVTWLVRIHPLIPYGIMGVAALISGLLCLTLPETKDQPTAEVCDSVKPQEEALVMENKLVVEPDKGQDTKM